MIAGIPAACSAQSACPVWNSASGCAGSKRMAHCPLGRCRERIRSAFFAIFAAIPGSIDVSQRQRLVAKIDHVLNRVLFDESAMCSSRVIRHEYQATS